MSNQNNMMQKMAIQSNVNLSRYKKDIDGTVKINDSNMAVVGNKFNPLTKVDTGMTTPNIMEVKDGLYGYGNYSQCCKYHMELIDLANKKDAIGIARGTDNSNSGVFCLNGSQFSFYSLADPTTEHLFTFTQIDNGFLVRKTRFSNIYFISSEGRYGLFNTDDFSCTFDQTAGNYEIFGSLQISKIKNYSSVTSFTSDGFETAMISNYKPQSGSKVFKVEMVKSDGTLTAFTTNKKWFNCGGYCLMLFDDNGVITELVFDTDTDTFREVNRANGSCDNFKDAYDWITTNLTTYKILEEEIVSNGWIFSKSIKVGGDDKFKLVSAINVGGENVSLTHSCTFSFDTSLENGKITDNCLYDIDTRHNAYNQNFTMFQGCNFLMSSSVGIGTVDQNYDSGIFENIYRSSNGSWFCYKIITLINPTNDPIPPITLGGNIYYTQRIETPIASSKVIKKVRCHLRDWIFSGGSANTFTSNDDWISRARYWVLGNKSMDNPFIIQMAPILSVISDSRINYNTFASFGYVYAQKNNTDATLYNYLNEPYTAPTDSDFYIPMAPTDKILGKVFDKVIIQRADGSTAELLRYNNKVYPVYMYSTISENIKYAFVCQGQVYKVANNIIYDSLGNGVCDVSDMEYIGGNGIVALFYNNRSKSIYQFSASNGIEVLFSSDDIKEIILTDISNTNDEVYIYCRNFDNKTKLICIESDGQIYTVTDSEITKFQIGKNGVYTWENGHVYEYKLLTFDNSTGNTRNNYIETNYYGTDEFKLVNIDRIYLRFCKVSGADIVNNAIVTLSMITVDGKEINEQYNIMLDGEGIHRIAPKQKNCIGLKVRIDGINDYTLTALSVGVTNDCNVIVDNTVINNNLDASIFE